MARDPLLTVRQLAEREGVPQWKIRDWLRGGSLPHFKANGVRIRDSEYQRWLEAQRRR